MSVSHKSSNAGRRPRLQSGDLTSRASLLQSARKVFARKGFDAATIREVAESARVNTAMISYHFGGKMQLYHAVLSESFREFDRIWEDPVFASDAPAREKIRVYIEGFIRYQHANDDLRRILSMEFASCGKHNRWLADEFFRHGYAHLAAIFREGMKRGELKRVDPLFAITGLVGMLLHPFILRPLAEYITKKRLNLGVRTFGEVITGMYLDGIAFQEKPGLGSHRTRRGAR